MQKSKERSIKKHDNIGIGMIHKITGKSSLILPAFIRSNHRLTQNQHDHYKGNRMASKSTMRLFESTVYGLNLKSVLWNTVRVFLPEQLWLKSHIQHCWIVIRWVKTHLHRLYRKEKSKGINNKKIQDSFSNDYLQFSETL